MVNPRFVIKAVLSGQRLNINVPLTVAGTVNYIGVEAKCTSEWDDCTVVCYLYQAGTGYTAQLGLIYDAERKLYYFPNAERLTLTAGEWSVWFVGVMAASGQETYKITSETRVFTVYEYPFASSIPSGDITLDEQAIAKATDAQNKANLILDLYNAGKLTGPKGDPGDPAEIGFVQASVDSSTSNPSCVVTVTENPENTYNMQFAFSGIKGTKGDTGATGPKGDTGATGAPGRDGVDGETIDDYVLVQAEQPTSETNKMWLKPTPSEDPVMIPTVEEFQDVETDVNNLKSATSYKTLTPVDMWHRGFWASADGSGNNTRTKYMRTNQSVNSNILEIECSADYKMSLLAYDEHTYVGQWDGTQFRVPTSPTEDAVAYYNLQAIRNEYPNYILRITVLRADEGVNLDINDAANNIWITQNVPISNEKQIDIISGSVANKKYWENGTINIVGNKEYNASNFYRRLSPINFFRFVTPTVLVPKSGIWFSVVVFELDGTFITATSGWSDVPYIFSNPNKLYGIILRPANDNIELFPSRIAEYIETYPYYITTFESVSASHMFVKVAAHRGYSTIAPENTIPAFRIASEYGFRYVEFDVQYTNDNVPVVLHDTTINRTARNLDGTNISETIDIANINYADLANYDFGVWKSAQFAGTKIPSLDEALYCCKVYNLHPYIELKTGHTYTSSDIAEIINLVRQNGMEENVTFFSRSLPTLTEIKNQWDTVELGYGGTVAEAETLRTGKNRVFMAFRYNADYSAAVAAGFQVDLWDADSLSSIRAINGNGFDLLITRSLLPSQINAILIDRFNNSIT